MKRIFIVCLCAAAVIGLSACTKVEKNPVTPTPSATTVSEPTSTPAEPTIMPELVPQTGSEATEIPTGQTPSPSAK